jgi:hypothetical protein
MSELNEIFENPASTTSSNGRLLPGTAQLTAVANNMANEVLKQMNSNISAYKDMIVASRSDSTAMDALLKQFIDYKEADAKFLLELPDETIESMLKSQQSKRSRAKGNTMTVDNYKSMMVAAIAENLLRAYSNRDTTSHRRSASTVAYTPEELAEFERDQDKLRREIRNVQSKKSIYKAKETADENSAYWRSLLVAEEQLKSLRVENVRVQKVDEARDQISTLLAGKDLQSLKAAEAKELLAKIIGITQPVVAAKEVESNVEG